MSVLFHVRNNTAILHRSWPWLYRMNVATSIIDHGLVNSHTSLRPHESSAVTLEMNKHTRY